MQAIGKSSIVVALVASVCVTLGVENAAGGSRCQIPASGAVSVYGPVGLPGNQATWKWPSFDPISGGPRHAYFVRKEKKGKKKIQGGWLFRAHIQRGLYIQV